MQFINQVRIEIQRAIRPMIDPPLPPDPMVQYWLQRHRGLTSFHLAHDRDSSHDPRRPVCSIYLILFSASIFLLALALFVGGFVLQFAGHLLEGTDPGEVIYFKAQVGDALCRVSSRPTFSTGRELARRREKGTSHTSRGRN